MPSYCTGLRACCGDTGQDWALCLPGGKTLCPPTPQRPAPSGWVAALSSHYHLTWTPLGRVQGNPSLSSHLQPAMEVLCFTVSLNIKMVAFKASEAQWPQGFTALCTHRLHLAPHFHPPKKGIQ